jgi:indole-3-glycerol phosphate synthase
MDILNKIACFKREEIRLRKERFPLKELQKSAYFDRVPLSFHKALNKQEPSVIAEFKRKSPSKGIINNVSDPLHVAAGYQAAGAAAISVLTDSEFFGGDNADLSIIANSSKVPLLRKDFIIDEYQIIESKSTGASAILLIGSILTREESKRFTKLAISLGLEVLFEIHDLKDLEKADENIRIVGVNNRNLRTFEVNMKNSIDLIAGLPQHCLKVAESGFQTVDDVQEMFSGGFDAFLIGERFMRDDDPGKSACEFISGLKNYAK